MTITMTSGSGRVRRRSLSLRTLLLLLVSGVGVYVLFLSLFLAFRMHPAAIVLRSDTQPVLRIFGVLTERSQRLDAAMRDLKGLVELGPPGYPAALSRLRQQLAEVSDPAASPIYLGLPEAMRAPIARADEAISRLESGVLEVISLLELGRYEASRARMLAVEALSGETDRYLAEAQRRGLEDLVGRESELARASAQALGAALWWLLVGLIFLPLVMLIARRRLGTPLEQLEAGLARVAEGDLHVAVPVHHPDEIGRLAEHFNQMTSVLRERAEEQGRFAAAGELIAGVAHEVNNPLMAISAVAQHRLDDDHLPPEYRQDLLQVLRQARRAGKLLSGLLRFAGSGGQPRGNTANLNQVVREAIDLVSYQFGVAEITLETRLDPSIPTVHGDPARLEQVLVNLLSNAVHAVRQVSPPRRLDLTTWQDADGVHLALEDNGPGIPAPLRRRLFRPFVTTKGRQGTGLGLYISRQIVRDAGGEITASTPAAGGARFLIRLRPSGTAPAVEKLRDLPERRGVMPLRGIQVLVVDDEEALRRPVVRFLTRRGARVLEAGDGVEALSRLDEAKGDVHAILADLRMPRMDGLAMHAVLQTTRPELAERVVFLSGDVSHLAERGDHAVPPDRVLLKPVALEEVEHRLLQVANWTGPTS